MKAGDHAPAIDWTTAVRSPASALNPPGLTGQHTVLRFCPNVTANPKTVDRWNELISAFDGRPMQFVWVASEERPALEAFLRDHPMKGWLLVDEEKEAAHAYGCDRGGDAIVDPSGTLAGFTAFVQAEQLSGILDGNAVAIEHDSDDVQVFRLLSGGKVRLESNADWFKPPTGAAKPDIAPSWKVHISPSRTKGTVASSGPDFWIQRGFDLRSILSMVYEKSPGRVLLPDALDKGDKFDFVVILPRHETRQAIHALVRSAIKRQFRVSAELETKPVDVYLMTALPGSTPDAKTGPDSFGGGFSGSTGFSFAVPTAKGSTPEEVEHALLEFLKKPQSMGLSNVSANNTTMAEFCELLERSLGQPVIDETGLDGVYDIEVTGDAQSNEEFFRALRDQAGLVLTPAERRIEFLTLKSL